MRRWASNLAREPVLHFILLGVVIFAVNGAMSGPDETGVQIPDSTRAALVAEFERQTGRAPDLEEQAALVDRWIDEELLFREGRRLGLDRGDPVVRRRIIDRMRALQRTMYPVPLPDDAVLEAWLAERADRYVLPGGTKATLEEVREAVEQDWMAEQERLVEEEALRRLREEIGL